MSNLTSRRLSRSHLFCTLLFHSRDLHFNRHGKHRFSLVVHYLDGHLAAMSSGQNIASDGCRCFRCFHLRGRDLGELLAFFIWEETAIVSHVKVKKRHLS